MRTGAVEILAGYDGEYGTIRIFSNTEREQLKGQHHFLRCRRLPQVQQSTWHQS